MMNDVRRLEGDRGLQKSGTEAAEVARDEEKTLALGNRGTAKGIKGRTGWILRLVVSGVLFGFVVSRIHVGEVVNLIRQTNSVYLVLVAVMLLADRLLMAYKWQLLTRVKGVGLSLWKSIQIYLISNLFGIFLPTGIGGDLYRVYYTSKRQGRMDEVVASVAVERMIGIAASSIFAIIGLTLLLGLQSKSVVSGTEGLVMILTVGGSLVGFWLSLHDATVVIVERLLARWREKKLVRKLLECQRAYLGYRRYPTTLLIFFLLSVVEQGFFAVANYYGAKALALNLGFIYFIGIIPVCQILMRIPVSINAIGVKEGLYVIFFSQVGLSATESFSLALLVRVMHWLVVLPGGFLYLGECVWERKPLATKVSD